MTGAIDRDWEVDCVVNAMFNDIIVNGWWGGVIKGSGVWVFNSFTFSQ